MMPSPEELNRKGLDFYKSGLLPEAIEAWEQAIALKADFAPAYINLTLAYLKKAKPDDAVRSAEKALALAPQHGAVHGILGNAYTAKGRWNEAVAAYTRAFELDKNQVNGLIAAGSLCLDHGLEARALGFWKQFLAAAPANHPKREEIQAEVTAYETKPSIIRKY